MERLTRLAAADGRGPRARPAGSRPSWPPRRRSRPGQRAARPSRSEVHLELAMGTSDGTGPVARWPPGSTSAWWSPTAATATDLLDVLGRDADPDGRVRLDGTDLRTVDPGRRPAGGAGRPARRGAVRGHAGRQPGDRRGPPDERPWPRRWPPRRPTRSATPCRTAWPPRSASAGARCPAVSGSGSPWPARWPPSRRCWCCTTRPPPIDAATEDRIAAGLDRAPGRPRARCWSPPARRCWPAATGWCWSATARSPPRARHASLVGDPAYRAAVLS